MARPQSLFPAIVGDAPARAQRCPLIRIAAACAAVLFGGGCSAVRTIIHNAADLDDHRIFANRVVEAPAAASRLEALARTPDFLRRLEVPDEDGRPTRLDGYLEATRTAAFVVLHEDRIVYERYARGFEASSPLNSFSIAKSILASLVGIALAEGSIASLDDPVSRYRPELAGHAYGPVTLRDLLAMTSGVEDPPSLLPGRAQFYYGDDLRRVIREARAGTQRNWRYSEADTQVLGFVLEAATGTTLSAYLSEKMWKPLGMEAPALWALDRAGGTEKAFCCISARARDFARFGRLFLESGRAHGAQLLPASWARHEAVEGVRLPDGYVHRQLWWLPEGAERDFYAYGHNGQYLYVNPRARVVIVKFSETSRQDPVPMFRAIARAIDTPERRAEIDRLAASTLASR